LLGGMGNVITHNLQKSFPVELFWLSRLQEVNPLCFFLCGVNSNLLHPQQSSRRAQMLVYLDPQRVDVTSCASVMGHIRGKLLYTLVESFLAMPPVRIVGGKALDVLPHYLVYFLVRGLPFLVDSGRWGAPQSLARRDRMGFSPPMSF
jgi:hypothetical protein